MDLQALFSDNQLAVLGCFVALAVCGSIVAISFHFGTAGQNSTRTTGLQDVTPRANPNRIPEGRTGIESGRWVA